MKLVPLEELRDWGPRELTPEEEAEVYQLAREQFTSADLEVFSDPDLEKWPDFTEMLDEMERRINEDVEGMTKHGG